MSVAAVIFDLDGVIVSTEEIWDDVRERYIREAGGRYDAAAQRAMMGMASHEWSAYLHDELGVARPTEQINADVVALMIGRYRERLPLIPGAKDAVAALDGRYALALASSSNRPLIDVVLELSGLARHFQATVSSDEVGRGKPWPDVYTEAARRLGVAVERCVAVEDSDNGIRSARTAGMRVVAIPNPGYPPDAAVLADADLILASIAELTPAVVARRI
jgi:HAD superfamily hydrolase (TIGR01509 family)